MASLVTKVPNIKGRPVRYASGGLLANRDPTSPTFCHMVLPWLSHGIFSYGKLR